MLGKSVSRHQAEGIWRRKISEKVMCFIGQLVQVLETAIGRNHGLQAPPDLVNGFEVSGYVLG